jgi:hypothetical protein
MPLVGPASNQSALAAARWRRRRVSNFKAHQERLALAYWDESGQRRETGFCLQTEFGVDGDRWVSAGKPEYEYDY